MGAGGRSLRVYESARDEHVVNSPMGALFLGAERKVAREIKKRRVVQSDLFSDDSIS